MPRVTLQVADLELKLSSVCLTSKHVSAPLPCGAFSKGAIGMCRMTNPVSLKVTGNAEAVLIPFVRCLLLSFLATKKSRVLRSLHKNQCLNNHA